MINIPMGVDEGKTLTEEKTVIGVTVVITGEDDTAVILWGITVVGGVIVAEGVIVEESIEKKNLKKALLQKVSKPQEGKSCEIQGDNQVMAVIVG